MRRNTIGLLLALMAFASSAFAYTARKEFRETRALRTGGELEVKNVNGSISVSSWDADSASVEAEIEVRASSRRDAEEFLQDVEIEIREIGTRLIVEAKHPRTGTGFWEWILGRRSPEVSIEFRLRLPRKCDASLRTVNGAIHVEGVSGTLSLSTTNGQIEARDVAGEVDASTVNGSLRIELTKVDPRARMEFKTVNGSIRLYLPEDARVDLDASTVNGRIDTDFPLQVSGKYVGQHLTGSLNGGGSSLRLRTVNGGIDVLRR
jgi:hypothetical protein